MTFDAFFWTLPTGQVTVEWFFPAVMGFFWLLFHAWDWLRDRWEASTVPPDTARLDVPPAP